MNATDRDLRQLYAGTDWGKLLLRAGFEPYDTEVAARRVAEHAAEEIRELKHLLKQTNDLVWRVSQESVPLFSSNRLSDLHHRCRNLIPDLRKTLLKHGCL